MQGAGFSCFRRGGPGRLVVIARKVRFKPIDAVIIFLCVVFGVYLYYRIRYGLEYKSDWSEIPQFLFRRDASTGRMAPNYLVQGLVMTLKLSIWAVVAGAIMGIVMGLFRAGKNLFLRMIAGAYVELVRNLPPLVLIFIFYFFVVDQFIPLLGVEEFIRSRSPGTKAMISLFFAPEALFTQFISGVAAIAFLEGAYITEIIRAGIESIDRGQREAACSLGLSWMDQMRFVIMPQAIKRTLPPLANEFINAIKHSAIASVVSIQELTFMGRQVVEATHQIFETWIAIALMYLTLTLSVSLLVARLEKKMGQSD